MLHIMHSRRSDRVAPGQTPTYWFSIGPTGMKDVPMKLLKSLKKVFMKDPTNFCGSEYAYTVTTSVGRSSELGRGEGEHTISCHISDKNHIAIECQEKL